MNPDLLVFHHIPKTAGTSVRVWLWEAFGRNRVFWHGENEDGCIEEVIAHHGVDYFDRYAVIGGHIPFSNQVLHDLPRRKLHAAILRRPEHQLVSHFEYVSHRPDHPLYAGDDLQHALEARTRFFEESTNMQTRYASNRETAAEAWQVFNETPFIVGCFDRTNFFLEEVSKVFNVPNPELPIENVQPLGYFERHYTSRVAGLIDRITHEDEILYRKVQELGVKSTLSGYNCRSVQESGTSQVGSTKQRLMHEDIKKTIWLTRPDLRELFSSDRDGFEVWLALNGVNEYQALQELRPSVAEDLLTEAAPEALPQVQPTLTRFMKAVWATRPDLRATFDLSTLEGQQGFIWWYFIYGTGELNLSRFLTDAQRHHLNEVEPQLPSGGWLPITRLMFSVWRHRPDLQQAFDIAAPQNHNAFLAWYFTHGMKELNLAQTVDGRQASVLLAPSQAGLERILSLLWSADEQLQKQFGSSNGEGYRHWATSDNGHRAYPILRRLAELREQTKHKANLVHIASPDLVFGVNLIGYAKGQLGIGEDVRMAALALEAAEIPFSIYNVEPGRDVCQGDNSAVQHISDALPYAINLFCTTGIETARLAAVEGSRLFDGRRSIGYWPWELPEWPADWHHAYSLVDEVWASSRFTYEAFARSSPKLVRHMPMAVTVDQTAGLTRGDFGLPENRFLFVFSFDFLSHLERKNPQACVAAFRTAFPRGDEPVGLVVKAMRATDDHPLWQALMAEAKADGRISIISGTLERGALLDLYRACDCFVSLHRSEGFGRGIVEAMMLEKPVIATGHSGNMDFTLPGTAGVVDYGVCHLSENDYPFGSGLTWADPDIDHAAWWMSRIACHSATRERLAYTAQILATNTYSPEVIGENYREVLCTSLSNRKSDTGL